MNSQKARRTTAARPLVAYRRWKSTPEFRKMTYPRETTEMAPAAATAPRAMLCHLS